MTQTATSAHDPEKLRALQRANEIRATRAELKRQIAGGTVAVSEGILNPPPPASSWPVAELLITQTAESARSRARPRRSGSAKCRKFLVRNQINEFKSVGELTERQRRLLATEL